MAFHFQCRPWYSASHQKLWPPKSKLPFDFLDANSTNKATVALESLNNSLLDLGISLQTACHVYQAPSRARLRGKLR